MRRNPKNIREFSKQISLLKNYSNCSNAWGALQHFESDTINGDGAMIGGVYYSSFQKLKKFVFRMLVRKSLDLEEITGN